MNSRLQNFIYYATKIDLALLFISAVAALVLAANGTYHFFLPLGKLVAYSAIIAIEAGIPGVILSLSPKQEAVERQGSTFLEVVLVVASLILAVVVSAAANFLYKVELLGIKINDVVQNGIQLGALALVLPILALIAVERFRVAFYRYQHQLNRRVPVVTRTEVGSTTRDERLKLLEEWVREVGVDNVSVESVSEEFNVGKSTAYKDLRIIKKKLGK